MKLTVDLAELKKVRAYIKRINAKKLEDIVWTSEGEVLPVKPEHVAEWKFVGLSNVTFAEHQFYKILKKREK